MTELCAQMSDQAREVMASETVLAPYNTHLLVGLPGGGGAGGVVGGDEGEPVMPNSRTIAMIETRRAHRQQAISTQCREKQGTVKRQMIVTRNACSAGACGSE